MTITLTDSPDPGDLARLSNSLSHFNEEYFGPADRRPLALFLRDDAGQVQGGLCGYTAWSWLYVQWLWLAPDLRGHGTAGRLLEQAEAEATARGCIGAWIDTFSPAAARVYQRAGYLPFGQLPDFPPGHTRTFLRKSLVQATQ